MGNSLQEVFRNSPQSYQPNIGFISVNIQKHIMLIKIHYSSLFHLRAESKASLWERSRSA